MNQYLDQAFLVCGILLFIWTIVLVGRRFINNKKYGEVINRIRDTGSIFDLILGLVMSAVSIADMVRCVIAEIGLDNRFYLTAAFAVYLLYKGVVKVELRENGIYTRENICLWSKIGSYEWKSTKNGAKWALKMNIKSKGKCPVFFLKSSDKGITDKILKEKIEGEDF